MPLRCAVLAFVRASQPLCLDWLVPTCSCLLPCPLGAARLAGWLAAEKEAADTWHDLQHKLNKERDLVAAEKGKAAATSEAAAPTQVCCTWALSMRAHSCGQTTDPPRLGFTPPAC